MIRDNSDLSWEAWGKSNPYYAVLTSDKFRRENLTDELKSEFFESGRSHVERILTTAETHFGPVVLRRSALDFGCGVGRLVVPFAHVFDRVTGVDISPSMLEEARVNCSKYEIKNAEFLLSDDKLSKVQARFDFVHSCIVLQHIPVGRGEHVFDRLLDLLSPGGFLAVQFPIARRASIARKFTHFLRRNIAPASALANVLQKKSWKEPFMQMNLYNMNRILELFARHEIGAFFSEFSVENGYLSVYVFAQKVDGLHSQT